MAAKIRVRHRFIASADPSIHAQGHKIPVAIVATLAAHMVVPGSNPYHIPPTEQRQWLYFLSARKRRATQIQNAGQAR